VRKNLRGVNRGGILGMFRHYLRKEKINI